MLKSLWESFSGRTSKDTASLLKENILFQDLTAKELRFVTHIVHLRTYRANEIIFRQGEPGVGMYIVANGQVNISVENSLDCKGAEEVVLTRLESGDFFGELALVEENGKRSATAKALENTHLIGFFKPNLIEILERSPATGVKISLRLSEVLGRRLVETNKSVSLLNEELNQFKNGAGA